MFVSGTGADAFGNTPCRTQPRQVSIDGACGRCAVYLAADVRSGCRIRRRWGGHVMKTLTAMYLRPYSARHLNGSFTDIELAQWIEEVGTTTGKKDIQDNAIQPAGCMVNAMGFFTAKELGAAQAGDCKEAKARQTKARPLY